MDEIIFGIFTNLSEFALEVCFSIAKELMYYFSCDVIICHPLKAWNTSFSPVNKNVSEYDQEIPQSHTADKPMTP